MRRWRRNETAKPRQWCDIESGEKTAKRDVSSANLETLDKKIDAETTQSATLGMLNDKQIFEKTSKGVVDVSYPVSDVVTLVKNPELKQHSIDPEQLTSRIAAVVKYGASTDQEPFVKTKGLITDLIVKLEKKVDPEGEHFDS